MNVLIVEDEIPAANRLSKLLQQLDNEICILHQADSIETAVQYLLSSPNLDLIFMDIQLADGLSFDIFEQVQVKTPVIFTTAFDQYAIRAFELNAVDYLLKPFSKERFDDALAKAVNRLEKEPADTDRIEKLVTTVSEAEGFLTRIVFRKGAGIKIIPLNNVFYLAAEDDYVMIYYSEGKALKPKTMKYYEDHLPPGLFMRVHRSYIVNVEQITRLEPYSKDNYVAVLKSGEKIPVSRAGYKMLREKLAF